MRLRLRIVLTERCNANCPHCFNAKARHGEEMDVSLLIDFMRLNKERVTQFYMIMGGEPTLHPRIEDVLYEAVRAKSCVELFTNGNTLDTFFEDRGLLALHKKGCIYLTINLYAFDLKKLKTYQKILNLASSCFHMVVPMEADAIYNKMREILAVNANFTINVSPDTTINLFDDEMLKQYRETWVNFLIKIRDKIQDRSVGRDHNFPACFYTVEMLRKLTENNLEGFLQNFRSGCDELTLGLIQPNFDLYHCNQTRIKLGSLLKDNKFVPYEEILKMLSKGRQMKKEAILKRNNKCRNCPSLDICLNGCYFNANTEEISKNCKVLPPSLC